MKLPISWLNEYVNVEDIDIKEFCHRMTMSGSKVEGYETACGNIENVVIGKIEKISEHPDADKLRICQVDVGNEVITVVTGASNVKEGDKVPVALPGAVLMGGIKIKKGKLRGVESDGMLCSEEEIGININGEKATGVMILDKNAPVGKDFVSEYNLKEDIVEFEITSNRPDCLGVIGLAREVAATFGRKLDLKKAAFKETTENINDYLKVTVSDNSVCNRYIARVVKNVKIGPSPLWMQRRLNRAGVRAINNIVDITNYVMLEYGQPMHAFDINYIDGKEIVVRYAKKDEEIVTLDGITRKLDESNLVIADTNKPNAVAGVMGGECSGVIDDTKTVVFESANFAGPSVRKTAQKLGLRTESSKRFEKGIDINAAKLAMDRALELINILGIGEVVEGEIDYKNYNEGSIKLHLDPEKINQFLGTDISKDEMIKILKSLEFEIENDYVIPPTFRSDITCFNDIAEEVIRIHGYDKLPSKLLEGAETEGGYNQEQSVENKIKQLLIDMGCYEVYTYSFTTPKLFELLRIEEDSKLRNTVVIKNPLGIENSIMRPTLIHSILEVLELNFNQRNKDVVVFEIANVYLNKDDNSLPYENKKLIIGGYGEIDFFKLKGILQTMLSKIGIKDLSYVPVNNNLTFHPYRAANIIDKKGNNIGVMGEIHPTVTGNYEIDEKVYIAEIDFEYLAANSTDEIKYKKLPKFPAVSRDLAIIVDDDVMVSQIEEIIIENAGKILDEINLFDVYKGEQIPKDKKSIAYSLSFRAADRTLTDDEVAKSMDKILKGLSKINAQLR